LLDAGNGVGRRSISLGAAFYGMKEFAVRDPGGHFITFAQQVAAPQR
jgi:hypothetical protein